MAANDRLGNLPERLGPVAARLVEYWAELPKTQLVPKRADLDPGAIREILPRFLMWELKSGHDAKWRLVGSGIREWFGRELTGESALGIHAEAARPKVIQAGLAMAAQPCGAWGLMTLHSPQGYDFVVESAVAAVARRRRPDQSVREHDGARAGSRLLRRHCRGWRAHGEFRRAPVHRHRRGTADFPRREG